MSVRAHGVLLLLPGLVFSAGCGDLFSACVKHDYEIDEEEAELAVNPEPFVLVNGSGKFTIADGCITQEDATCTDEFGIVAGSVSVSGALVDSSLEFASFTAGPVVGAGEVFVSATSDDGTALSGSAVVQVVLPDGANVEPRCSSGAAAVAPFPVPRASELGVTWAFTLDGVERTGWTGEVPVEGPGLTLQETDGQLEASFLMPDTVGVLEVRSTIGASSFEVETFDPSGASLSIVPYPSSGDYLTYLVRAEHAALEGRTPCVNPRMTLTLTTPEICTFGGSTARPVLTDTPEDDGRFALLPLAAGLCGVTVDLDGTSTSASFDLEVVPTSP